ncbi:uncharacterized protein LOC144019778 [Festucalex cinctus]
MKIHDTLASLCPRQIAKYCRHAKFCFVRKKSWHIKACQMITSEACMMNVLQGELHLPLVLLLQLSCVVMTATCTGDAVTTLRGNLRAAEKALCNLAVAEIDYVQYIFNGNPPPKYRHRSLDPIRGLTIPAGNSSSEVRAAVSAIGDHLERHLPPIVGYLTQQQRHREQLLGNISVFYQQFKDAVTLMALQQREADGEPTQTPSTTRTTTTEYRRPLVSSHGYQLKKDGLRIIYYIRKWVEDFTRLQPTCLRNELSLFFTD